MAAKKKKSNPIAIVDIGSNSVRIVVYHSATGKRRILVEDKANCGLAKGMRHDRKRLNPAGMKKTLITLRRFKKLLQKYEITRVVAVGTAAMRLAHHTPHGEKFHKQAERALGHKIRIISGPEEAELGAIGVMQDWPKASGICGDLGGGSMELTRVRKGKIFQAISLPYGSLTLLNETNGDRAEAAKLLRKRLQKLKWLRKGNSTFYTIGGSWRTVARVLHGKGKTHSAKMHGKKIAAKPALPFLKIMAQAEASAFKKMGKKIKHRAAQIPVAALILVELLTLIGPKRIIFSGHGVREGLLRTATKKQPFVG